MSDNFWKKISYYAGYIPIGALFGLVVYFANFEIRDLDLWLHIAMGRFIAVNHFVPDFDVLSCSLAGAPWNNHEWLFQVLVYNLYRLWGADGMLRMQMVVVALTMFVLLLLGYNREKQISTIIGLLLVFLVFQQRFTIRPDIFSLLFFALYIYVLALHIDKKWAIVALFIIQMFWTNFHGFFFFGPLFICIGLVSEWLRRHIRLPYEWNESGNLNDEEYRRLKVILLFVILACCVNPAFAKGAVYPIGVFFSLSGENKIFFDYIQELQRPVEWSTLFQAGEFRFYKLLILISSLTFLFNRRRIDISALLFWLIFLVFSLKAARNASFFAFAAYLVIINNNLSTDYSQIMPIRFTGKKFQHITSAFVKLLILVWILQFGEGVATRSYYDFDKYERKSEFGGISLRSYPTKAVDFLVHNQVSGNFFNDFNSGAYLLGRTHPQIKVFIDGRTEVYGGNFFRQYQKIWDQGDKELFEKVVKEMNITGALFNATRHRIPTNLIQYLYQHKDWTMVYFDYDAVVFLRNVKLNAKVIEQHKIDLKNWEGEDYDLMKMGPEKVLPYQPYYRAYTLETLKLYDLALREADKALAVAPNYAEPYSIKGKIYAQKKDFQKAFENFRIGVMLNPGKKEAQHNLSLAYMDLEAYTWAIKQYRKIMAIWPNDPKAYFFLAKALAKNEQYTESLEALGQAHQMNPKDVIDIIKIGDIAFEQYSYETAKDMYTLALTTKKDLASTHTKLGLVHKVLGKTLEAKKAFETALSLDPENKKIRQHLKDLP